MTRKIILTTFPFLYLLCQCLTLLNVCLCWNINCCDGHLPTWICCHCVLLKQNTWATLNWICYIYIYIFAIMIQTFLFNNRQCSNISNCCWKTAIANVSYHSRYGLSQWKMTLQCNIISPWLSAYSMCILCMGSANERRRYYVTSSLIGWAHTQWLVTSTLYVWCHLNIPSLGLTVSQFHIWDPSPNLSRVPVSLSGMYRSLVE